MRTPLQNLHNLESSSQKIKYTCTTCDYTTSRKSSMDAHNHSKRHTLNTLNNVHINVIGNSAKYQCKNCDKIYKNRNGLWYHNKSCLPPKETDLTDPPPATDALLAPENLMNINVIYELIKQNNEFKTLLVEQNSKIMELAKEKSMTVNNNNTINNNQKFNMNFFLNEQCKDALDIMDFVNSLQLNLADLEHTGNVGYVKGVSDIFLRGLRELDVYKRPIHCSDLKREVMYVKDNNVWEKDEDKKKMKKAVHYIAGRNFKQIHEWMDQNPDSRDIKTKKHNQYMTIVRKCTGGFDAEEDDVLFNKVIANVAKEVVIEK